MSQTFIVTVQGNNMGPFNVETIIDMVAKKQITVTDYVYDEQKQDWYMIVEHEAFLAKLQRMNLAPAQAKTREQSKLQDELSEKAWFILKDGNNYGPFSKLEIVQLLQGKNLFDHDFIWAQHLPQWQRVADTQEFSQEKLRELREAGVVEVTEIFFRRRHSRAEYGASIIVHNNHKVFKGQGIEVSTGGAGLLIDNTKIEPGEKLYLHFKPGDGVPPFNAVCEVVSKHASQVVVDGKATARYGVKFKTIAKDIRESLRHFSKRAS